MLQKIKKVCLLCTEYNVSKFMTHALYILAFNLDFIWKKESLTKMLKVTEQDNLCGLWSLNLYDYFIL